MGKQTLVNNWRFERKFALTPIEFIQFEKQLMISDIRVLYPKRKINNCYLDDVHSTSYFESIEGLAEKTKVRIRWYGELFGKHIPTLEFKMKQNNSNRKELFKLFEVDFFKDFDWVRFSNNTREYLLEKNNFHLSERLQPVLINSYERSYYTNFNQTYRLTIDSSMQFLSPDGILKNRIPRTVEKKIIELKFNNSLILSDFPIMNNLGKFSKFTVGIDLIK